MATGINLETLRIRNSCTSLSDNRLPYSSEKNSQNSALVNLPIDILQYIAEFTATGGNVSNFDSARFSVAFGRTCNRMHLISQDTTKDAIHFCNFQILNKINSSMLTKIFKLDPPEPVISLDDDRAVPDSEKQDSALLQLPGEILNQIADWTATGSTLMYAPARFSVVFGRTCVRMYLSSHNITNRVIPLCYNASKQLKQKLEIRSIPPSIGSLVQLEQLYLNNIQLMSIPSSLLQLQSLSLDHNN